GGARLLGGDRAGKALLARPLDHHDLADGHAALQIGPLDAVAERKRQRSELRRHVIGHAVEHSGGMEVLILAVAAPPRWRDRDRRRAIADGCFLGRPVERVSLVTKPEVTAAAITAVAAREILFERDAVAFLDAEARGRDGPEACHMSDRLVAEDKRAAYLR